MKPSRPPKQLSSIRYSPEAKRLLEALAAKLALPQSGIVELAIRTLAKQEGLITPPSPAAPTP